MQTFEADGIRSTSTYGGELGIADISEEKLLS